MAVASSASVFVPRNRRHGLFILPYQRSSHRGTITRVSFDGGTPFASDQCVCHIRDCDFFSQFLSPIYTSCPAPCQAPVESNHPMSTQYSEKLFCAIYFNQADSCHPRTPTSQGIDTSSRRFYVDCFKLAKVTERVAVAQSISTHTFNIYSAVMQCTADILVRTTASVAFMSPT